MSQNKPQNINTWCFFLGREPKLSAAEIQAVFEICQLKASFTLVGEEKYLITETTTDFKIEKLISRLGGTIKIARKLNCDSTKIEDIALCLNEYIPDGKIIFSINEIYGKKTGLEIKRLLKNMNRMVRYVEIKNTASIIHNHLVEKGADLTMLAGGLFVTVAVQPIEAFGQRDYGRPGRDDISGMLPPKLAMMMINLAEPLTESVILDPFCGSGTILTEAMLLGYQNISGCDLSSKSIEDSTRNIAWIKEKNARLKETPVRLWQQDARDLASIVEAESIDAIVTEPYMGQPLRGNEQKIQLQKQAEELKQLYVASFGAFHKILKPGAVVIFIIPRFKYGNDWVMIDIITALEKIGFNIQPFTNIAPYLLYHRPNQFVGREIWKFIRK